MHLVEAESTGPVEGEEPVVTPPRPPHRRVSVSLLFTLTVLIGTVVAIYVGFPPRHHVLMTEAIAQHREPSPAWDLVQPSDVQLRAWVLGVVGGKALPLPTDAMAGAGSRRVVIDGARRIEVLNRPTAVIGFHVGAEAVTYVVQRAGSVGPDLTERTDDELRAITWQTGAFRFVLVGGDRSVDSWRKSIK